MMVHSELAGQMVDSSSEQWRHETECAWLLANMPNRQAKHLHCYGVNDRAVMFDRFGQMHEEFTARARLPPSIYKARGLDAADRLMADAKRLWELRKERASSEHR